ncbi:MAG: energy transducer TonB [Muribaculaceae bacterium]|nr:energy transducer TonB [Muribaculaceae bacterium]
MFLFQYFSTGHIRLLLPAVVAAAFFVAPEANGQTCRISVGATPQGQQCYMEVYEYDYVTEKPAYPGGDAQLIEFINANRQYPDRAYREGVQGRVTCSFVVNANGQISHIKVLKSVEESLNREAVRILSLMPDWEPGRVDGHPVPVRVIRSIPFRK